MKKLLVLVGIMITIWGCEVDKPEQLPISEEKLISVLTDFYLLQARYDYQLSFDSVQTLNKKSLTKQYDLTEKELDSTFNLLIKYPKYFAVIQDSVDKRLQYFQRTLSK